jgi:hypothetical protein
LDWTRRAIPQMSVICFTNLLLIEIGVRRRNAQEVPRPDVSQESKQAEGLEFGKPSGTSRVLNLASLLLKSGWLDCCLSTTRPGDKVFVALGRKNPFVLRPDGDRFLLRFRLCAWNNARRSRGVWRTSF